MKMREVVTIPLHDFLHAKEKLIAWGSRMEYFMMLDSNSQARESFLPPLYHENDFLVGAGCTRVCTPPENSFQALQDFLDSEKDWAFGHFSYDLKNELEGLQSRNPDFIGFPLLSFFVPRWVFKMAGEKLEIFYRPEIDTPGSVRDVWEEIMHFPVKTGKAHELHLQPRLTAGEYKQDILAILQHLHRGDIFEINYCLEFFMENCRLSPEDLYLAYSQNYPAPFGAYYKQGDVYLISSSPERFMKKVGRKILSQPMKGTGKRGRHPAENERLANSLQNDPKEIAENTMIVDLVRNDLSRVAAPGSVKVEELRGVYPFGHVHQMISTVSCELDAREHPVAAIQAAFPMGSMTGAPKIRAMELADRYERARRGLYSGAIGYFEPGGDFDFNVVIRSFQYNARAKYLNYMAGSAITALSEAGKEYKECLLKAKAVHGVLSRTNDHVAL